MRKYLHAVTHGAEFPDRRLFVWPPVDERGNLDRRVFALIQHTDRCMGRYRDAGPPIVGKLDGFVIDYNSGPAEWLPPGSCAVVYPNGRNEVIAPRRTYAADLGRSDQPPELREWADDPDDMADDDARNYGVPDSEPL